ncbi:MAG: electron transport complex subunit RsxC, partial [Magnetococcales bacterium]|nr:electron transport complex subunit RsxC [Magnetococcales bacterium]
LRALQTGECVIGIEDNKPAAVKAMEAAARDDGGRIRVVRLPVMYPQGSEKQLIEVVTGRQVPSGGLPIDVGVIVHNVGTALAIRDAVREGKPLISRVVTVSGRGIQRPANLEVRIGTPVQDLVDYCGGLKPGVVKLVSGGPMMGVAIHTTRAPVVKGTSGILALLAEEVPASREQGCIRCGHCLQACPMSLMPNEMAWLARHELLDKLAEHDLFDCIECGSCSYVCPASIPLVQYFRFGKFAIRNRDQEKKKQEISRARTLAKEARVAREQEEKERKKAEMKAGMAAKKKAQVEQVPDPSAVPSVSATAPAGEAKSASVAAVPGGDDKAERAARAAKAAAAAKAAKAAKAARQAKDTE